MLPTTAKNAPGQGTHSTRVACSLVMGVFVIAIGTGLTACESAGDDDRRPPDLSTARCQQDDDCPIGQACRVATGECYDPDVAQVDMACPAGQTWFDGACRDDVVSDGGVDMEAEHDLGAVEDMAILDLSAPRDLVVVDLAPQRDLMKRLMFVDAEGCVSPKNLKFPNGGVVVVEQWGFTVKGGPAQANRDSINAGDKLFSGTIDEFVCATIVGFAGNPTEATADLAKVGRVGVPACKLVSGAIGWAHDGICQSCLPGTNACGNSCCK